MYIHFTVNDFIEFYKWWADCESSTRCPFSTLCVWQKSPLPRIWQKVLAAYISQEGGAEESWSMLRNHIAHICLDGMIYVQKLNSDYKCKYCSAHGYGRRGSEEGEQEEGSTDMWGLIIQGRSGGVSCCASYILKTTRFVSENGCWTQFSLVKAKCFGECPSTQFIRSWLFQSEQVWSWIHQLLDPLQYSMDVIMSLLIELFWQNKLPSDDLIPGK